jgi:hypothetical protein
MSVKTGEGHLGTGPEMWDTNPSNRMHDVGFDIGKYFAALTTGTDWEGPSFVSEVDGQQLGYRDVRSWEYYPASFGGGLDAGVAAALSTFQSVMNTVDLFFGMDPLSLTTFKLTYVSLYHVLRGLREFLDLPDSPIRASARAMLEEILADPLVDLVLATQTVPLRNTLVHYGLDTRISRTELDEAAPLSGLAAIFFPGHDPDQLNLDVRSKAADLAGLLNSWSSAE